MGLFKLHGTVVDRMLERVTFGSCARQMWTQPSAAADMTCSRCAHARGETLTLDKGSGFLHPCLLAPWHNGFCLGVVCHSII